MLKTHRVAAVLVPLALGLAALPAGAAGQAADPDCIGPAGDPAPGTPQWQQRELDNAYCGEQRASDTTSNPLFGTAATEMTVRHGSDFRADPFRDPLVLAGKRFRYETVPVPSPSGGTVPGMLFRPCDATCSPLPAGLDAFDPPYPGVVIVHGGAANQEMYLWGAEGLAEAGYMVLTFQLPEEDNLGGDAHYDYAKTALDYFASTPSTPAAGDSVNPHWGELDRSRIGLAGHSAGGVAVSRLGQEDPRVSAIVSWDRAQSGPMPDGLGLRTPALFVIADYLCQRVPVCVPQPYDEPPSYDGPGNKGEDYQRVSASGVDSMQLSLRAATHLDFTQFPPAGTGSRFGAAVAFYYTLAWFDRYLWARGGARPADALRRLVATRFDDSGDLHSISGGVFDAATMQNVPALIGGQPVPDRLSFEFRSAYFLEGGLFRCTDMRAGCPAPAGASPAGEAAGAAGPSRRARRCKRKRKRDAAATRRRCRHRRR